MGLRVSSTDRCNQQSLLRVHRKNIVKLMMYIHIHETNKQAKVFLQRGRIIRSWKFLRLYLDDVFEKVGDAERA